MALSSESLPSPRHQHRQCGYAGQLGCCEEPSEPGSGYCFWHCPEADKSGQDVKERLEQRARIGRPMEGFRLCNALLDNINLVNRDGEPFQLVNSDLSRASLHKAHLYRLDLSGSSLFKTNLSHANLHRANLSGCNLLGANLKNSLLDHVDWGGKLYQELMAEEKTDQAGLYYEEAEEVARNIRRQCERQGIPEVAGHFYYQEMVFHRLQMPRFSARRVVSWLVDLVSGYGESPLKVVFFSSLLVLMCSLIYFVTGIQDSGVLVMYRPENSWLVNLKSWLDCLYFSVVTFTTLGYGDLTPSGLSRIVAAFEAFTGSFSLALFVVVFVKKMTR